MWEHSLCEHSVFTCYHITHHKPKEENTKKKFLGQVLGPDDEKCENYHGEHSMCEHSM